MKHVIYHRLPYLFCALLFLSIYSCSGTKNTSNFDQNQPLLIKKVDDISNIDHGDYTKLMELAEKTFTSEKYPGMAVIAWKQGNKIMSQGFGYADIKKHIPISSKRSKFRIGSISKTLTTSALAKLVEKNQIDLDQSIHEYLDPALFPKKKYDITLRQIAGHLGGIRHYNGFEFMSNTHYPSVVEGLHIFANDTLLFKPGSQYSYSSYGFNLLSAAMETASSRSFLKLMDEEVFKPIGMKNTSPEYSNKHTFNLVQFYCKSNTGNTKPCVAVDNSYKWAGGGFISTAEDILEFGKAHIIDNFIKPELFDEWTSPQSKNDGKPTSYGIGWRSGKDKKERNWIGHSGGSVGGNSMLLIYPENEIIIVVLINQSPGKAGDLAFKLANQILP